MPAPSRALRRLSLVPHLARDGQGGTALWTLRMAGAFSAVLTALFGWTYGAVVPDAYDPVGARVLIAGGGVALVALSFADTVVRRRPFVSLGAYLYGVLGWFGYLAYVNALAAPYAVGYLFVVVAVSMGYSVVCTTARPMAWMLALSTGLGFAVALGVEDPEIPPSVFVVCLVPSAVMIYYAFWARLLTVRSLRASEAGLSDAEELARIGSWSLDFRTGQHRWSPGTYRIVGWDRSREPIALREFVYDDLDAVQEERERFYREGHKADHQLRIRRADGEIRTVRSIVRLSRGRDGAPVQLQGVLLDITEQTALVDGLRAARDEAEAAAAAKAAFLANMSHEIRTPLTAIIGFAQILREEAEGAFADLIEPIESGGRRLLDTLNSVLDIARMEAGETDLDLAPIPLVAEVRGVTDLLRGQAHDKGLALTLDAPDTEVVVQADAAALARVFTNLLSNAVKFTGAGGVSVAVRAEAGRAVVEVADTGRGMDAGTLARVFEPFQQASTGWARSHEGTGLGLTITHRLVEAMNGSIEVESEVGVGTRFTVSLPVVPGAEPGPAAVAGGAAAETVSGLAPLAV